MTRSLSSPTANRVLVLMALLALTPVLLLVVELPMRNLSLNFLGSALSIRLDTDSLLILLLPVIAVAPNDALLDKLKSNMEEVRARGGELYLFADETVAHGMTGRHVVKLPATGIIAAPVVSTIPLQLLAYHIAVLRGTDVDQPRNLAKSVTVE